MKNYGISEGVIRRGRRPRRCQVIDDPLITKLPVTLGLEHPTIIRRVLGSKFPSGVHNSLYAVLPFTPREDEGDREGIAHTHPTP